MTIRDVEALTASSWPARSVVVRSYCHWSKADLDMCPSSRSRAGRRRRCAAPTARQITHSDPSRFPPSTLGNWREPDRDTLDALTYQACFAADSVAVDFQGTGADRTSRKCRWCGEPIKFVEPDEACGWAHRDLPGPGVLRFWCGTDEDGKERRVEPRMERLAASAMECPGGLEPSGTEQVRSE